MCDVGEKLSSTATDARGRNWPIQKRRSRSRINVRQTFLKVATGSLYLFSGRPVSTCFLTIVRAAWFFDPSPFDLSRIRSTKTEYRKEAKMTPCDLPKDGEGTGVEKLMEAPRFEKAV